MSVPTLPEPSPPTDAQKLRMRGVALLAGVLFGAGLLISGMTRPAKVVGFLDVAGAWDPSLALVMVGAIGVYAVAARLARRRDRPIYADGFQWPTPRDIDGRLIGGSALFGVGWGLVGYCPGPAIVGLGAGSMSAAWFCGAMALGMVAYRFTAGRAAP